MAAQASTSSLSSAFKPDSKDSATTASVPANSSESGLLEEPNPVQPEASSRFGKRPWISSKINSFALSHPRVHSNLSRAWLWVRGPRPKVDLPPPSWKLDINFKTSKHTVHIPIESAILKAHKYTRKIWLFMLLVIGYIVGIAFLSYHHSFREMSAVPLTCLATYWSANSLCGLNGADCLPLNTTSTLDFRCPPRCENTIIGNPRTIGNEELAFVPLIVGGGDEDKTYRADSFICAAAQHSGVISGKKATCARLSLVGEYTNFLPAVANGLQSIGFPTTFPLAFRFSQDASAELGCRQDLQVVALFVNAISTAAVIMLLQPTPLAVFWSLVCIGFWDISLFSDPGSSIPNIERAFGRFLPLLFIAYVFWRAAFRYTLPFLLQLPLQACVLYGLPFWVGVLNGRTFDRLPLGRLTASDIGKRPGSIATLVILILVVLVCSINQVRVIRKTGWLPFYIKWYAVGGVILLIVALLPTLSLRLHHYIIPMLLLPGTAFPTRTSAVYQGVLLGLFLHGVARWNFASIVQTAQSLRGDAVLGSTLPTFLTNSTTYNTSLPLTEQTLRWAPVLPGDPWLGFSLLVDDVERYVGIGLEFSLASLNTNIPHFFRLAYKSDGALGDYTKAATLWPNGTWVDPVSGASY